MSHASADNARVRVLLDEIDELKERNRQLVKQLGPSWSPPIGWGLTGAQARAVSALMSRDVCTFEMLMDAVDGGAATSSQCSIAVLLHRARKKLTPLGIHVRSIYGIGYSIDKATRERILKGTGNGQDGKG